MAPLRTLAHLLLALVLMAGGMVPGVAMAAAPESGQQDAPPCHGTPEAPEPAVPMDCCDDGSCDCLHSPPPLVEVRMALTASIQAGHRDTGSVRGPPGEPTAPGIRPPIA